MGLEYIYAALLLHELEKPLEEEGISKIMEAAGVSADAARIKALVESLEGVDMSEVIKGAATSPVVAVTVPAKGEEKGKEEGKEKGKEEEKEEEGAALEGLSALFG